MVLRKVLPIAAIVLLALPVLAEDKARPGEVVLPLKDYLALVETADAVQRAQAERIRQQAAPVVEVVSQRVKATIEDGEARVVSEFEVLVQGYPGKPVLLPLAGYPSTVEILREGRPEPAAAVSAIGGKSGGKGGVLLLAPEPGRYSIQIQGRTAVENLGGISKLSFPPAAAPVSVTEVDLPAESSWTAPGGVVVEEREQGSRRTVRLASKRGEPQVLELKRRFDSADAERLLAQAVVLTIFQLRPEGPRRHDVVLYDVSRGSLPSFAVDLPPGIEVEQTGTDEGSAVPVVENGRLTVHRHRQLQGTGYLVLTSTPSTTLLAEGSALVPILPAALDVRARYLAVASSIAAEARPLPEAAWARVDLADLPASFSEALEVIDLAAAWRLADPGSAGAARLAVKALAPAPSLDEPVRRRETTTILTMDDALLHRDLFTLGPVTRPGAALEIALPAGAKLWSAKVGDQPVRPLERGGKISVPLGFTAGAETVVEVVAVLEKAVPKGRSELGIELPQVALPVLEHRWRVLLPEVNRYRFREGALRSAAAPLVRIADRAAISGSEAPRWAVDGVVISDTMPVSGLGGNSAVLGTLVDDQGAPLPGATLTLTGGGLPPMQQVSDAQGHFRFLTLPPGSYTLVAALEGFPSIECPNVQVTSGRNVVVEITMNRGIEETITVTAESPLLDERKTGRTESILLNEGSGGGNLSLDFRRRKKKPATGATVSGGELDKIPTARDPYFDFDGFEELRQGLVGGVRPLNVTIPESGKALFLAGVLPPTQVSLTLDVRAKK